MSAFKQDGRKLQATLYHFSELKAADLERARNPPTLLANHRRATGESVEEPAVSLRTPWSEHRCPASSVAKPNL